MAEFGGIFGYNYEPEWPAGQKDYSDSEESNSESDHSNVDLEEPEACECDHCVDKPTAEENLCCKHHIRLQDVVHDLLQPIQIFLLLFCKDLF